VVYLPHSIRVRLVLRTAWKLKVGGAESPGGGLQILQHPVEGTLLLQERLRTAAQAL
jgi:hypothetical protein